MRGRQVACLMVLSALLCLFQGVAHSKDRLAAAGSVDKAEVHAVIISKEVKDEQKLYILLGSDGTISRRGSASALYEDPDFYRGTSKRLFRQFMMLVPEYIFDYAGSYDIEDKRGDSCTLKLLFKVKNPKRIVGFEYFYGSDSEEPPDEVAELVRNAVEITDGWYSSQRQAQGR